MAASWWASYRSPTSRYWRKLRRARVVRRAFGFLECWLASLNPRARTAGATAAASLRLISLLAAKARTSRRARVSRLGEHQLGDAKPAAIARVCASALGHGRA